MDVPIVEWQRHCSRVTTIRHHPVFPFGGSIVECGSLKLSRLNLTESEGENFMIVEFQALESRITSDALKIKSATVVKQ
jgi:hypothetical protein